MPSRALMVPGALRRPPLLCRRYGTQVRRAPRLGRPLVLTCALGLAGAAAVWAWTASRPTGPSEWTYGSTTLLQTRLVPPMSAARFDVLEMPMHRLLDVSAAHALAPPPIGPACDSVRARLAIYSYFVKEPTIQVERAYTPLHALGRADPAALSLLVKRYADGEVSRFLHRLPVGSPVHVRGPSLTWKLPDEQPVPREIVMVRACTHLSWSPAPAWPLPTSCCPTCTTGPSCCPTRLV